MKMDDELKNIEGLFKDSKGDATEYHFQELRGAFMEMTDKKDSKKKFSKKIKILIMLNVFIGTVILVGSLGLFSESNGAKSKIGAQVYKNKDTQIKYPVLTIEEYSQESELYERSTQPLFIDKIASQPIPNLQQTKKTVGFKKERPGIIAYSQRFKISRQTRLTELEQIKLDAWSKGILFDYHAFIENDELVKLNYSLIKAQSTNSIPLPKQTIDLQKGVEHSFGWLVKEDGIMELNHDADHVSAIEDSLKIQPVLPYAQKFQFYKNTSEKELERIKNIALKSGINFKYKRKFENDSLIYALIEMSLKTVEISTVTKIEFEYPQDDHDTTIFGWCNDENGKFVEFRVGSDEEYKQQKKHFTVDSEDFPIKHYITINTTKSEIEEIMELARLAGLDLKIAAKYRFNKMNSINIVMKRGESLNNKSRYKRIVSGMKEEDCFVIMWKENRQRKATDFHIDLCENIK